MNFNESTAITARIRARHALSMRTHLIRIMPSWDAWPHMLGPVNHDPIILRAAARIHKEPGR